VEKFQQVIGKTWNNLVKLSEKGSVSVLIFSLRPDQFDLGEFESFIGDITDDITFVSDIKQLADINRTFDIALVCIHNLHEHMVIFELRKRNIAQVICGWTWDNHHHLEKVLRVIAFCDVVFPSHNFVREQIRTPIAILGRHIPHCITQWSRSSAATYYSETGHKKRSDDLYGSHSHISWAVDRNNLISECIKNVPDNVLKLLDTNSRNSYFCMSSRVRFQEWASYKVSLNIPVEKDLSQRIFDGLLTGQIPLVPENCIDLDAVIPRSVQEQLPVVRFSDYTSQAVEEAWKIALEHFDAGGEEGAAKRHQFALNNHHISNRIEDMLGSLLDAPKYKMPCLRGDRISIGYELCERKGT